MICFKTPGKFKNQLAHYTTSFVDTSEKVTIYILNPEEQNFIHV